MILNGQGSSVFLSPSKFSHACDGWCTAIAMLRWKMHPRAAVPVAHEADGSVLDPCREANGVLACLGQRGALGVRDPS